jgi:predicted GNAT family acetyltransferase
MNQDSSPVVRHHVAEHRYEILLGEELVGFADYHEWGGRRVFSHTEIASAHEGRGLGGRLVGAALDDTRSAGLSVHPQCSFVRRYIERHQEYADLIAAS